MLAGTPGCISRVIQVTSKSKKTVFFRNRMLTMLWLRSAPIMTEMMQQDPSCHN